MKYLRIILTILLLATGTVSPLLANDTNLQGMTADASPTDDDLVYSLNDPAGTPGDRKVTWANLWGYVYAKITSTLGSAYDTSAELDALFAATVQKSDFEAQSILAAVTSGVPDYVVVQEQQVIGRQTGGNISAINIGNSPLYVAQWPTDPAAHTLFGFDNTQNIYTPILIGNGLSYDQPTNTVSVSVIKVSADCSGETSGCCWETSSQILYCYDGADMSPVGRVGYNSPDNMQFDIVDDNYLSNRVLADMTEADAETTEPSQVIGKCYTYDPTAWDPGSQSVDYTASTIAWVSGSPATLTDSASGFVTAGYEVGMVLRSSTSTNNTGRYHIASVSAGTITLDAGDSVTSEAEGSSETLTGGYIGEACYAASGTWKVRWNSNIDLLTNKIQLQYGNDPDLDKTGQVSHDVNNGSLRGTDDDGSTQFAWAFKTKTLFRFTVPTPNDYADAMRDHFPIGTNNTGYSMTVTEIICTSDTDDTALTLYEEDADGQNDATIDAIAIATDETGQFKDDQTSITGPTIEAGHQVYADFDDTDTPGWVHCEVIGRYNADVN